MIGGGGSLLGVISGGDSYILSVRQGGDFYTTTETVRGGVEGGRGGVIKVTMVIGMVVVIGSRGTRLRLPPWTSRVARV